MISSLKSFNHSSALQLLLVGLITTTSVVSSWVPSLQFSKATVDFSTAAHAQTVSDEEVQNYAQSVLAIEPFRQRAYDEIKNRLGSREVPAIACHRPNSLNNLNREIRQIAVNYCNQSIQIVEQNNLTIGRFNAITTDLQTDSVLSDRIQRELLRLQQNSSTPR